MPLSGLLLITGFAMARVETTDVDVIDIKVVTVLSVEYYDGVISLHTRFRR